MSDDDEDNADPIIFLEPPDVADDSGADDADEREGGVAHDLHFDQLRQQCELRFGRLDEEDIESSDKEPMEIGQIESASPLPSTSAVAKNHFNKDCWW